MDKWDALKIISRSCEDHYGSLLLELMDRFNKVNLQQLTEDEVFEYFEELKGKGKIKWLH